MTKEEARAAFLAAGIENAAGEARILEEAFRGNIPPDVVQKRCTHYPLQYLLGKWGFWREEYEVSEDCLIPRPDTEILVEQAVKRLPPGGRFLDLCTGSGCVAVSTLATRADTAAVAVDLFPKTLELARRNAARNGVERRVEFLLADVTGTPPGVLREMPLFSAILANPPYVRSDEMDMLPPEVRREPAAALFGGEDGMNFYRAILRKWRVLLREDGFFLFEIGAGQRRDMEILAKEQGLRSEFFRDYGGKDRVSFLCAR